MRARLRYLTCKLHLVSRPGTTSHKKVTALEILRAIKESLHANFGDFGAAALLTTLQVRFYDEATHVFILRCPRDGYRSAWAAMTLLTALGGGGSGTGSGTGSGGGGGGTKASISVLHVSGSVRTCRKDAVDILVQEAAAAAADAGGQGEVEGADAKRGYYQAQIEGAIQGV